ncbi:winged helix-turn-helix transcriptional regulator [Halobacterium sp. CBA1126]|uniref:winged helix-turn-helix transcriptional regulator n=1 Tax=Halobacterium sp. CBA1126 TaxID=2668074 RepID=UPI0012FA3BDA|nr:winged helix-turn-helix transcriptional regulator [Halobacterium sp. CBA1126]MUV60012.1 winged helix-turn-helix transcriptional regulator [Halobacterium sp. CBA1126]
MGGRPPDTTDREILGIFSTSDDPVLSTTEVADQLSYSQPGTYSRLAELEEEGLLHSKDIGNAKAWWLTDDGQRFLEDTNANFAADLEG